MSRTRRQRRRTRVFVAFGVAAVLVGAGIIALASWLAGTGKLQTNLGRDVFDVGPAAVLAREVQADGPLLFQDLLGRTRDIYVQHLGGSRWTAFEAHPPGEERRCQLQWRRRQHNFRDPCTRRIYPGDGAGLVHYQATVGRNDRLVIDLRVRTP